MLGCLLVTCQSASGRCSPGSRSPSLFPLPETFHITAFALWDNPREVPRHFREILWVGVLGWGAGGESIILSVLSKDRCPSIRNRLRRRVFVHASFESCRDVVLRALRSSWGSFNLMARSLCEEEAKVSAVSVGGGFIARVNKILGVVCIIWTHFTFSRMIRFPRGVYKEKTYQGENTS